MNATTTTTKTTKLSAEQQAYIEAKAIKSILFDDMNEVEESEYDALEEKWLVACDVYKIAVERLIEWGFNGIKTSQKTKAMYRAQKSLLDSLYEKRNRPGIQQKLIELTMSLDASTL